MPKNDKPRQIAGVLVDQIVDPLIRLQLLLLRRVLCLRHLLRQRHDPQFDDHWRHVTVTEARFHNADVTTLTLCVACQGCQTVL